MPKMVSQEEDFSQLKDNKEILEYEFETALANLQNTANNRISASTHTYRSYKEAWEKAQRKNRGSYPMSNETIKEETISYYKKRSGINLKNLTGEEKEILEQVISNLTHQ